MGGGSEKADQDPVAARIPHDVDTLINPCLWTQSNNDTGFIDMKPYKVKLKPVYIKQYPLSKEKEDGIKPIIYHFV